MSIFNKLSTTYFTASDENLVKHLMDNYEDFLKFNLDKLSSITHSSPASIVRFVQKLGYSGFNEFKIALASEYADTFKVSENINADLPINKESTVSEIIKNMMEIETNAINELKHMVDEEEILKACNYINSSSFIDIYGNSTYLNFAQNFKFNMMRLGKHVQLNGTREDELYCAYNSDAEHCAIIITYSGTNKRLEKIIESLIKSHTRIILITSINVNQDFITDDMSLLYMVSRESTPMVFGLVQSRTSLLILLDILYAYCFKSNYENNLKKIKNLSNFIY